MSRTSLLSPRQLAAHAAIRDLLDATINLAKEMRDQEHLEVLQQRRAGLDSAALFVVVGEVKAGKSSFINALLGEDVCEVAPDPCTAVIQEIVFGEERTSTSLGDFWERVRLPREVLREISIVDTPGTNSVIKKHQTLTEKYIPQSDLIVFVFAAKNPHTASAWDLLSMIRKDWHRKVVFILQQSDLATQHELATNTDRVKQYARERNVQDPAIFAVSAKNEEEGVSDSGFLAFRSFIRDAVENGEVWQMKLEGARDTVRSVIESQQERLMHDQSMLKEDLAFYQHLVSRVSARRKKAEGLKKLVLDNLCGTYESLTRRLEGDFRTGLSVGKILRRSIPFVRDKDIKTWLTELETTFETNASERIEADTLVVSRDLADEMQAMINELSSEIENRRETIAANFERFGMERLNLLERLRGKLQGLRIVDIVGEQGLEGSDLGSLTLAGGGLAALGTVIALATKLVVFDITGGVLAAVGAAIIAAALIWKRRSILSDFSNKLARSKEEFRTRLDQDISAINSKLFHEIEHVVSEPIGRLQEKIGQIQPWIDQARVLESRVDELS